MSETIRVKKTTTGNIMLMEKGGPWCIDFPEDEIDDVIADLKEIKDDGH